MKNLLKSRDVVVFYIIALLLALAPLLLSEFRINLLGKFICFAIVAIGIDLIWGYTGILSLGHGVFFGLGGYCMAMYLKLNSSGGQLPDFMSWSGVSELPFFWKPFESMTFAMVMVIVVPAVVALVLGYFTFKNRITGVYFSILSQALSIIFVVLFIGQQAYTGGTNGITNLSMIGNLSLYDSNVKLGLYYVSLAALVAIFFLCKLLVRTRCGKVLLAIRDGENRVRFTGYDTTKYKVFVYCVSAAIAGIAGALFVPQVGIITPNEMAIIFSVEMVIWVAIGGRGTLIGALLMNLIKTGVSEAFPDMWLYFLGISFIVVVVFLPKGIMGVVNNFKTKNKKEEKEVALKSV